MLALWIGQRQGDLLRLPWSGYDGAHIRLRQSKTGIRVVIPVGGPLKAALDAWFGEVRKADWRSSADVKRLYASASIVSADRIVFNIKGNDYRLVVSTDFEKGIVWIKWVGTHRNYDRIDVRRVEHGGR